jgi:ribosomal protein S18 acetylase RimI-like enzyme
LAIDEDAIVTIRDLDYTHSQEELDESRELSLLSYTASHKPRNWRVALLENWSYASRYMEPVAYFTDSVHLWRNEANELVGYLIRYYDKTYPQVHPEYQFLEDEMWEWAEQHWSGEDARIVTVAFDYDTTRTELLVQRGYQKTGETDLVHIHDLSRSFPPAALPAGFRIASLSEIGNHAERVALENSIWGVTLDEAWFRGKSSAPSYSLDWDLVVVSPDGQQVAASLVWVDARNQSGEIDPLGTHPDFRRLGLARALVAESFRRMRAAGLQRAYIASEADPNNVVNRLYESFKPIETYHGHRWVKEL